MRIIYLLSGWTSVGLAVVGVVMPLLPTVPFLLLAAYCFAKSSTAAHQWLIDHKFFGPPILNWQQNGSIRRPAKILSTICILAVFLISIALKITISALVIQAIVLICVSFFIWSRPEV
jgi:uncharacterized membrane protein YbaN (DUF454 family)